MNKLFLGVLVSFGISGVAMAVDITPPADGNCYIQQWTDPVIEDGVTKVLIKQAYKVYEDVPAVFEEAVVTVTAKEAYVEYDVNDPTWSTSTGSEPTGTGSYWVRDTCEPGSYCPETLPPTTEYDIQKLGANDAPTPVEIPEVTQEVKYMKLVQPASTIEKEMPAEYKDLPTQTVIMPGKLEWVVADCDGPSILTKEKIMQIQQALMDEGYTLKYGADGIIGKYTKALILLYRSDNGLPATTAVDNALLASLGITGWTL